MKLVFPNSESEPTELKAGRNVIGSADDADIRVRHDSIAPHHAIIDYNDGACVISVENATNITRVNGNLVVARTRLQGGEALLFGKVQCQLAGRAAPTQSAPATPSTAAEAEDAGATKVRMAIPQYVLRGVSGSTFGKTYPVFGAAVVGRQSDCDICLPGEEISRRHARLTPGPEGLMVEDMDSSNGTFINGKRIEKAVLKAGDELRLDTVRLLLQTPGTDAKPTLPGAQPRPDAAAASGSGAVKWALIGTLVIAGVVAALVLSGIVEF